MARANIKYSYLSELKNDLQGLDRQSPLYKMLKYELSMLGYWKNKQRGDSKKGYQAMIEKINNA